MQKESIVSMENIQKKFRNNCVLNNLSFSVQECTIYGLIGKNGAGKTTTLRIISGLLSASSGKVIFHKEKKYIRVGFLSENNCLYNQLSVRDNIMFYLKMVGLDTQETLDYYIDLFGLYEFRKQRVNKLSKGMKRRVAMTRAIVGNPDVLLLDEPFDGIDIDSKMVIIKVVKEWVNNDNRCVIISSHNLNEIEEMCDVVGIIDKGKIIYQEKISEIKKKKIKCIRIVPKSIKDITCYFDALNYEYDIIGEVIFLKSNLEESEEIFRSLVERFDIIEFNKIYYNLEEIYKKAIDNE